MFSCNVLKPLACLFWVGVGLGVESAAWATTHWSRSQLLTAPSPAQGNEFGVSMAMSDTRLVIGEPYATVGGKSQAGLVHVFVLSNNSWFYEQTLQDSPPQANAHFGKAVGVSGDQILIGAPETPCCQPSQAGAGELVIFHWDGLGSWVRGETVPGAEGDHFGAAIAVDQDLAIVGFPQGGSQPGRAHVYRYTLANNLWQQVAAGLYPSDYQAGELFGSSVAIRSETNIGGGALAMVGAPNYTGTKLLEGAAYAYYIHDGQWKQFQAFYDSAPTLGGNYGKSVAVSAPHSVLIAAPTNSIVRAFKLNDAGTSLDFNITLGVASIGAQAGASIAVDANVAKPNAIFGAPHASDGVNSDAGAVYFIGETGTPSYWNFDGGEVPFEPYVQNSQFGSSVAINGSFAAAGIPQYTVSTFYAGGAVAILRIDDIFANGFEIPVN